MRRVLFLLVNLLIKTTYKVQREAYDLHWEAVKRKRNPLSKLRAAVELIVDDQLCRRCPGCGNIAWLLSTPFYHAPHCIVPMVETYLDTLKKR